MYGCSSSSHRSGSGCHAHVTPTAQNYGQMCGVISAHWLTRSVNPVPGGTGGGGGSHADFDTGIPCGNNPIIVNPPPPPPPPQDPTLSVSGETVDEGDGAADFTITLSRTVTAPVTFDVATSDGTATEGDDYSPVTRQVTIPAGRTSAVVSTTVLDDSDDESDETFMMTLSNPSSNAELGASSSAEATITDDDTPPPGEVSNVVFECFASGGTFTLNASWDPPSAGASGYQVQLSPNPTPWDRNGELHFGLQTTTTMTATALSAGTYYAVIWPYGIPGVGNGTQTQMPTECLPEVTIADAADVSEGSPLVFTVSLSAASSSDVTVNTTAAGITAVVGDDFLARTGSVTIPASSTSVDVRVFTIGDTDDELDETLELRLSLPSGATLGTPSTASGRIIDDDEPEVSLPASGLMVNEGDPVTVTATLDQAPSGAASVRFTTSGAVDGRRVLHHRR